MTKPSVGRIVHYQTGTVCLAAIITEVSTDLVVGLDVFDPYGLKHLRIENGGVTYGESSNPNTWHWPERVE